MPFRATPESGRARRVSFHCFVSALPVGTRHPRDSRAAVGASCRRRLCALVLPLTIALWPGDVPAHDPSAWGGLFRTRDAGVTWLHVNPGSFVSGALALAVSPMNPNHLLLATDSGVSRSRNGGRDWEIEGLEFFGGRSATDCTGTRRQQECGHDRPCKSNKPCHR